MEEEKIVYKLVKQPLSSEIKEQKEKNRHNLLMAILCLSFLALGLLLGVAITKINMIGAGGDDAEFAKWQNLKAYMNNVWLYGEEYENLDETLNDQAFYGMMSFEDDPYTTYMSKEDYLAFSQSINMNFVGIGINFQVRDGVATVLRVLKNSPAEKAGLLAGDIIRKIDNKDIKGMTTDEIKELALGEEGSLVEVGVERNGEFKNIGVIRSSIDNTAYAYAEGDTVILEIHSFGDSTYNECVEYLEEFKDYQKIIIDLRNNGGGFQTAVQDVATLFLGEDVLVMTQEFKDGHKEAYYTSGSAYYPNFKKVAVLTNENTASAAEVLAIAIKQQHSDATLIGTTTFGKGVVQSSYILPDQSVIKLTTSKWLAPDGDWYNEVGIKPDIEVFLDDILYEHYSMMEEDDSYSLDSVSIYNAFASKALAFLGYDVERFDGYFDDNLFANLKAFQSAKNLEDNGVLDYSTYNSLLSSVFYEWSSNPLKDLQMVEAKSFLKGQ